MFCLQRLINAPIAHAFIQEWPGQHFLFFLIASVLRFEKMITKQYFLFTEVIVQVQK